MSFSIGQRVGFLYEKGYGTVTSISGQMAQVLDETGFDRSFPFNELVVIHSERYTDDDIVFTKEEGIVDQNYRIVEQRTGVKKPQTVWEIDLHIEEILESTQGMSNTEILMKQMKEFRSLFKKAKSKMVHKLIVIHGVGEGVLKNEIRTYLALQDQIEVYDADYSEYGKGATAIEFHPNW